MVKKQTDIKDTFIFTFELLNSSLVLIKLGVNFAILSLQTKKKYCKAKKYLLGCFSLLKRTKEVVYFYKKKKQGSQMRALRCW